MKVITTGILVDGLGVEQGAITEEERVREILFREGREG